jgi:hypothetical protein
MDEAVISFLHIFCNLIASDLDGSYSDVCVTTDLPFTVVSSLLPV